MRLRYTERFRRSYESAPPAIQHAFERRLTVVDRHDLKRRAAPVGHYEPRTHTHPRDELRQGASELLGIDGGAHGPDLQGQRELTLGRLILSRTTSGALPQSLKGAVSSHS